MRAVEAGTKFLLAGWHGWNHYHSISKDINIVHNRALQQFHLSNTVRSGCENSCFVSYMAQRRAEKQPWRCHRGYFEVERLKVVGIRKWELKASSFFFFFPLHFLLNVFLPWWETVGRRERNFIFWHKPVHSLQEQELVTFPGTAKIHFNKSRRNMCKLGLGETKFADLLHESFVPHWAEACVCGSRVLGCVDGGGDGIGFHLRARSVWLWLVISLRIACISTASGERLGWVSQPGKEAGRKRESCGGRGC